MTENKPKKDLSFLAFGIFNLALVLILSHMRVFLISTAMVLLICCGIAVSFSDFKETKRIQSLLALLLHLAAAAVYVFAFGARLLYRIRF